MLIEVLRRSSDPAKVQGDALEEFISKWMKIRGYEVVRNVRSVGCEIDLLCKDQLANKRLYVECKAYNDKTYIVGVLHVDISAKDNIIEINPEKTTPMTNLRTVLIAISALIFIIIL